jgi:diketogulonate reductase-like aldo/keto reductase
MRMDRRTFIGSGLVSVAGLALPGAASIALAETGPLTRTIPSSGETMPLVGLGSWITFNVGDDPVLLDRSADVIKAFVDGGGRMIDSSPMYGSAQNTIGYGLNKLGYPETVFAADKVWTSWPSRGRSQIAASRQNWGVPEYDLVQVHNLLAWEEHLKTLRAMKEAGETNYIGITTSHGRRHDLVERVMRSEPIDFIQVTYNAADREVADRILPLAQERGIGVIINRPYRRGALIDAMRGKPLPPWAGEAGASSWAQFLLRYVISHPAVTCAIPATTKVSHIRENLNCAAGVLPDAKLRERMAAYVRDV